MRYQILAIDYDGTLAKNGVVDRSTVEALRRLLATGRRLVLVTGRELPHLQAIFQHLDLFEWVVAENGGVLFHPQTKEEVALADPPPVQFVETLRSSGCTSLSIGRVIVATWEPHQRIVLDTIRQLGLELQVIFNKGAVMVLPAGINKASGLSAALKKMGVSPHNAVGIGDAENDHAMLQLSEFSVAVANAIASVKESADWTTVADHGQGVEELAEKIIANDLADWLPPSGLLPDKITSMVLITVHPRMLSSAVLQRMDSMIAVGADAAENLNFFAQAANDPSPVWQGPTLETGQVLYWMRTGGSPRMVVAYPCKQERRRHRRKFAKLLNATIPCQQMARCRCPGLNRSILKATSNPK